MSDLKDIFSLPEKALSLSQHLFFPLATPNASVARIVLFLLAAPIAFVQEFLTSLQHSCSLLAAIYAFVQECVLFLWHSFTADHRNPFKKCLPYLLHSYFSLALFHFPCSSGIPFFFVQEFLVFLWHSFCSCSKCKSPPPPHHHSQPHSFSPRTLSMPYQLLSVGDPISCCL